MDLTSSSFMTLPSQTTYISNITTTLSLRHFELTAASPSETKPGQGCLVQEHNPKDDTENVISKEAYFWIKIIIASGIVPILFLVGVPGNILTAVVFYKQGLKERINFCICCLAFVDLVVITADFFIEAEGAYRRYVGSSNFFIRYFVGLTGFTWVSMFLSAVIAAERCFCVVSPLRAQHMLSTRTLAVIITPLSLIILTGILVIVGPKHIEACLFDPKTNTTSYIVYVTEYYLENKEILDPIDTFFYAMALPLFFIAVIVLTTVITAVKLRWASRWRQQTSSAPGAQATGSFESHMVALTRMLIATSVLFVVCQTPVLIVQMAMYWVTELKFGARYHNLTSILWDIIPMCRCINSSFNFFVYYKMGSRFRQTLKQLMPCKTVQTGPSASSVYTTNISNLSK